MLPTARRWPLIARLSLIGFLIIAIALSIVLQLPLLDIDSAVQGPAVAVLSVILVVCGIVVPLSIRLTKTTDRNDLEQQNTRTLAWDICSPSYENKLLETRPRTPLTKNITLIETLSHRQSEMIISQEMTEAANLGRLAIRTTVAELCDAKWNVETLWRKRTGRSRKRPYMIPRPYSILLMLQVDQKNLNTLMVHRETLQASLRQWIRSNVVITQVHATDVISECKNDLDQESVRTLPNSELVQKLGITIKVSNAPGDPQFFALSYLVNKFSSLGIVATRTLLSGIACILLSITFGLIIPSEFQKNGSLIALLPALVIMVFASLVAVGVTALYMSRPESNTTSNAEFVYDIACAVVLAEVLVLSGTINSNALVGTSFSIVMVLQTKHHVGLMSMNMMKQELSTHLVPLMMALSWIVMAPQSYANDAWYTWVPGVFLSFWWLRRLNRSNNPLIWRILIAGIPVIPLLALICSFPTNRQLPPVMPLELDSTAKIDLSMQLFIAANIDTLLAVTSIFFVAILFIEKWYSHSRRTWKLLLLAPWVLTISLSLIFALSRNRMTKMTNVGNLFESMQLTGYLIPLTANVVFVLWCFVVYYARSVKPNLDCLPIIVFSQALIVSGGNMFALVLIQGSDNYDIGLVVNFDYVRIFTVALAVIFFFIGNREKENTADFRTLRLAVNSTLLSIAAFGVQMILFNSYAIATDLRDGTFVYNSKHLPFSVIFDDIFNSIIVSRWLTVVLCMTLICLPIIFGMVGRKSSFYRLASSFARSRILMLDTSRFDRFGIYFGLLIVFQILFSMNWATSIATLGRAVAAAVCLLVLCLTVFRYYSPGRINSFCLIISIISSLAFVSFGILASALVLVILGGPFESPFRVTRLPSIRSFRRSLIIASLICVYGLLINGFDDYFSPILVAFAVLFLGSFIQPSAPLDLVMSERRRISESLRTFVFWFSIPAAMCVVIVGVLTIYILTSSDFGLSSTKPGKFVWEQVVLFGSFFISMGVVIYQGLAGWIFGGWYGLRTMRARGSDGRVSASAFCRAYRDAEQMGSTES